MSGGILKFSVADVGANRDEKRAVLVQSLTTLTKMAINGEYDVNPRIIRKYSVVGEDYNALNQKTLANLFKFCAEKAGMTDFDPNNKGKLNLAFGHPTFSWEFFAIMSEVINSVNATVEIADIMRFAQITDVGAGDSMAFELESKKLYDISDASYNSNVARAQRQFRTVLNLTPSPKSASVSFDAYQLATLGYDFGKEIAKIALSFRAQMYQDICDELFDTANVTGTPFYEANFDKDKYMAMATRIGALNGVRPVAYGTLAAFADITDGLSGYATKDELIKNGYIGSPHGVPSVLLEQAVNTANATFAFRVPADKILLASAVNDKPIKVVREDFTTIKDVQAIDNSLNERRYMVIQSWTVGFIALAVMGLMGTTISAG